MMRTRTEQPIPAIVIDTREQAPLPFPAGTWERGTLATADYSLKGYETLFGIERKSLADLLQSLTRGRGRFERELARLAAFDFRRVLVEAPYSMVDTGRADYWPTSRATPKSVVASIAAFEVRYGVPFVFAASRAEAARRIRTWARYWLAEHGKGGGGTGLQRPFSGDLRRGAACPGVAAGERPRGAITGDSGREQEHGG